MFDNFDPSLLDDPDFKEDAVREEIVVPILRRLGYSASGPNRIVRSKALLHPFVMIGSKRHPVHIVPDYLLHSDGRPGLVLDAKRPDTDLVKSKHAEQAYSYAIHPEVRVRFYALCSGRQLVAYDIYGIAPIFVIDFQHIGREWALVESVLSPKNVSFAAEMHFVPDFGTAVVKMGSSSGQPWFFPFVKFQQFGCVRNDLYTMSVGIQIDDVEHLASFDADKPMFDKILQFTDSENRDHIRELIAPGQMITALRPIYASLDAVVGRPTRGQHDAFVPFLIKGAQRLDESAFQAAEALSEIEKSPCQRTQSGQGRN
ncbi:type I restriction enzyme HsdR N-terminal domain-containing protein [Candidatus Laterigemmans baculatus]|nr:type I restriction enzyme HsdR N-terminal domain-containing protein [Candidatus Laterigemmans baculatus]